MIKAFVHTLEPDQAALAAGILKRLLILQQVLELQL
jgi:hypothetical protein